MAFDFTLTSEQLALQKTAREFAQELLKPDFAEADALADHATGMSHDEGRLPRSLQTGFRQVPAGK